MTTTGSYLHVDIGVVRTVVAELAGEFATKDVSEDPRMLAAHASLQLHRSYHAFVGRAISEHRSDLGLDEVRKATARGSVWRKQGTSSTVRAEAQTAPQARPPRPAAAPAGVEPGGDLDLGPQYGGDAPFAARMRRHQSWYRAQVLGVGCGTGPRPSSTARYGNMLTREDGDRGLNFVTPTAFAAARDRVAAGGGAVEPFRLFHNMLSSMPMCFNLFGPLIDDPELATRVKQDTDSESDYSD